MLCVCAQVAKKYGERERGTWDGEKVCSWDKPVNVALSVMDYSSLALIESVIDREVILKEDIQEFVHPDIREGGQHLGLSPPIDGVEGCGGVSREGDTPEPPIVHAAVKWLVPKLVVAKIEGVIVAIEIEDGVRKVSQRRIPFQVKVDKEHEGVRNIRIDNHCHLTPPTQLDWDTSLAPSTYNCTIRCCVVL